MKTKNILKASFLFFLFTILINTLLFSQIDDNIDIYNNGYRLIKKESTDMNTNEISAKWEYTYNDKGLLKQKIFYLYIYFIKL